MISEAELYILSYYRACELAGSVLFGKLALHSDLDKYRGPLTQHCLEEAEHAWLWTKTIQNLGETPLKITHTYQTEYGKRFGLPENIMEIFCLTQVFERRTLDHFTKHLYILDTHPLIKKTLQKMIDDESGHIGWIKKELDSYEQTRGPAGYTNIMKKFEAMDNEVYTTVMNTAPFKEYFSHLL